MRKGNNGKQKEIRKISFDDDDDDDDDDDVYISVKGNTWGVYYDDNITTKQYKIKPVHVFQILNRSHVASRAYSTKFSFINCVIFGLVLELFVC